MALQPLTSVPKIPLEEGWEIQALAAGRTSDGHPTTVALWNSKIKTAQTILLDDITARDALAAHFARLASLDADLLSAMLVQLLPKVQEALREQEQGKLEHQTTQ